LKGEFIESHPDFCGAYFVADLLSTPPNATVASVSSLRTIVPFQSQFDFGTSSSPLMPGFQRVSQTTKYTPALGFGWTAGKISTADHRSGTQLERDVALAAQAAFVVDVPHGTCLVEMLLGDRRTAHDQMGLALEGQDVDSVTTAAKTQVWQTYTVAVDDGQLTLNLRDLGGKDKNVAIAGLRVIAAPPDATPPSVSIQLPTAADGELTDAPFVVGVTFSEPVAGFTADDLQVDWSGPGTLTTSASGMGANYEVTIGGMAGNGSLSIAVPADSAVDLSGNPNRSSEEVPIDFRYEKRLDFGKAKSAVEPGYQRVANTTKYTVAAGFGWQAGRISSADRSRGTALERDLNLTADGTFAVNIPPGTYSVKLWLGDLGTTAHDQMGVFLEGHQVDTVSTDARTLVSKVYTVPVTDGQLTVRLKDLGGRDKNVALAGLTVTYVDAAGAAEGEPAAASAATLSSLLTIAAAPSVPLAEDVNGDGLVTPLDALLVINYANTYGVDAAGSAGDLQALGSDAYDVNRDGLITPWDVLLVINALDSAFADLGEGEDDASAPSARDAADTHDLVFQALGDIGTGRLPSLDSSASHILATDDVDEELLNTLAPLCRQ